MLPSRSAHQPDFLIYGGRSNRYSIDVTLAATAIVWLTQREFRVRLFRWQVAAHWYAVASLRLQSQGVRDGASALQKEPITHGPHLL